MNDRIMNGSPVVRGSRVPVRRLWEWHTKGVETETLAKRYPTIAFVKILDALSFAYDNRDLIEADIAREQAILESEGAVVAPAHATFFRWLA